MTVHPLAEPFHAAGDPATEEGRTGVLLQHGFSGSPYSMKPWAQHLAAKGHTVSVPRLPGHGTTWQELNSKTWADWYAETSRAFAELRSQVDRVVVCGLSMGGALVLRLAADHPEAVAGAVLVNPAVNLARFDVKLLPVLKHVVPAFPGVTNDIKKPGVEENGYNRTPLRAAHSMLQGVKALRADLGRVTSPVLMFRSVEDHLVDPSSGRILRERLGSSDVREELLHDSYHVATLDNDAPRIFEESAQFIARVTGASVGG